MSLALSCLAYDPSHAVDATTELKPEPPIGIFAHTPSEARVGEGVGDRCRRCFCDPEQHQGIKHY